MTRCNVPAATACVTSEMVVRETLGRAFPGTPLRAERAFTRAGMSPEELVRLHELVGADTCTDVLEIGMGCGTSSVVMLSALASKPAGHLTSIDPFQTSSFQRAGVGRVEALGYAERHRLIEEPDYLALPNLLSSGQRFDFILVDGYHSFDYTLVDMFFADLLLKTGGVLAVHDSSWATVLHAIRFFEANKSYARVSPKPLLERKGLIAKAVGRFRIYAGGPASVKDFENRRRNWHTLAAYRKVGDNMPSETELAF